MKPSMGRVVLFFDSSVNVVGPATVTHVHKDGTIAIRGGGWADEYGHMQFVQAYVKHKDVAKPDESYWDWPPRVSE